MQKVKWQIDAEPAISANLQTSLEMALQKKYQVFLQNETFLLEAEVATDWVQVRTTLRNSDGTFLYPVEAIVISMRAEENFPEVSADLLARRPSKVDLDTNEKLALFAVDFLDSYWNEYLTQGRDTFLSLDWQENAFEGETVFVRGFSRNQKLESMADELFRLHGNGEYDIKPIGNSETDATE